MDLFLFSCSIDTNDQSGAIFRTTFGPAFYESMNAFPKSRIIVDLNLGNNTLEIARDEMQAALEFLGSDRIRAFELGNEPDHYPGGLRPRGWNSANYTAQFLEWSGSLQSNLSLPLHQFWAGGIVDSWSTAQLISEGITGANSVQTFSQHMLVLLVLLVLQSVEFIDDVIEWVSYPFSTCDPTRNALANLTSLVNHQNIASFLDTLKPQVAAAKSVGADFVIGATLVAQSNQQANGPGLSWYDLWYPVESDRFGPPSVSPSFVAYLLVTEAIGTTSTSSIQYSPPSSFPQLATYFIFEGSTVRRVVLLNLAPRMVGESSSSEGDVVVDVSSLVLGGSKRGVRVKRMTASGIDVTKTKTRSYYPFSIEAPVKNPGPSFEPFWGILMWRQITTSPNIPQPTTRNETQGRSRF
ncbi:hypothetical protein NLI96_g9644 [Meripilus lineatus]|uniref:Beta-glucuronidase C-terminal domain-containing protein n=1 Tax=Meripilus lineatus TaxID=2056292 RepID=A0AAD5UWM0_9APHY|nr:hypothetical protein NLI96_g9644 [Physisporinus lineatus]